MPSTTRFPCAYLFRAIVGLLVWYCCHSAAAHAYTFFLDQDTKGQVMTAHWPDDRLPLLFSIDKEDLLLDGKTMLLLAKEAAILWKQVPGSRLGLQVEGLDKDINVSNFRQEVTLGDLRHELIIEQDGKILQSLGLDPDFVAGVGVPVTETNPTGKLDGPFGGKIVDAFVIINTKHAWDAGRMMRLLTHELGHVLGLGHSNVVHPRGVEELPVMFYDPIQQEGAALLHADDQAGIASLYPGPTFETTYGAIRGRVVRADQTPVFGVAVFAESSMTGPIGTWSDGDGQFLLTGLPPGGYTVLARAIDGSTEVKGMTPANHVGGLISKATTSFCPEYFNDRSFTNCRFSPGSPWTIQVEVGRTRAPLVIEEQRGNPAPVPGCVLGAAPVLPGRAHGLPALSSGTRGDVCPVPPEPIATEEPTTPDVSESLEPVGQEVRPDFNPNELAIQPVCGCQAGDDPWMSVLLILGVFFLISRRGGVQAGRSFS